MATTPDYYITSDDVFTICIDDISFVEFVPQQFTTAAHYKVYMKGNSNTLQVKYSDGVEILNILIMTRNCYRDENLRGDDPKVPAQIDPLLTKPTDIFNIENDNICYISDESTQNEE